MKFQSRRANVLLLPWWKISGHQRTGALGFLGRRSLYLPPALCLPGLCVRKEFIIAHVWEEAQGTASKKYLRRGKKKMLLEDKIFQSLCSFVVSFDPAMKIDRFTSTGVR